MTGERARVRWRIADFLIGERRLQMSVWNDFAFAQLCRKGPQFLNGVQQWIINMAFCLIGVLGIVPAETWRALRT